MTKDQHERGEREREREREREAINGWAIPSALYLS